MGEVYRTADVLDDNPSRFEDMMLKEPILKGLKEGGFLTPSPIQSAAIPVAMLSADLIAQAKSGTGKTCVFVTSVLNSIDFTSFRTQALVLAPTREIAVQIRDVFREIGKYIDNFECHSFIGGIQMKADIQLLKLGCQVAVGTPGRVHDLIEKAYLKTMFLQIVVLDEADQLFGPSFEETIIHILSMVPKQKQLMAFTATLLDDAEEKISSHMHEPEFVAIDQLKPSLKGVRQFYKKIDPDAGDDSEESRVTHNHKLLKQKVEVLIGILTNTSFNQAVVFSNNKRRAHDIAETLTKNGWPTQHIHGGQPQTQRLAVFEKLRNFKIRVLVSSDVTARGIDIERLTLVINLDIPHNAETYMHRVGRTGRFGTKGVAVTFVTPGETVQFDVMVKKLQAIVEPLPPKIDQDMLNLWLKEGEEDALKELEKHRERAQEKEVIPLRDPMVQPFANERRKKRKRGRKQAPAAKKEPIEARFLSGQSVMATRWEAWHQASVVDLTDGNHVVKLQWDDKENSIGTRSVRDVVAKKKPAVLKTGMACLGNFDGSWYICKIKKINKEEGTATVEWAYHEGEEELEQNEFLCYEPFEEHSFEKRQANLDSDEELEFLTPKESEVDSMPNTNSKASKTPDREVASMPDNQVKSEYSSKSPNSSEYQRLLARNTMANTTPAFKPVGLKPRKKSRSKQRRKQTADPQTPQFSPYARMHPAFSESTEEPVESARSVAPSVVSVGISQPHLEENISETSRAKGRLQETADAQTPQFSPYAGEHPAFNDSAEEPVDCARSVAPSVVSVAISRQQVPPSPRYPPIPGPTHMHQPLSNGKKQQPPQRPHSSPQQQQQMYSKPQQQQRQLPQPQQQQAQYSQPQQQQPQFPHPQQQQPQFPHPQQQRPQFPQTQKQQSQYSNQSIYGTHPSFTRPAYSEYEPMRFPRIMYRPGVFYPPVLPPAPSCSDPRVVSQSSLQAARWLLQTV